MAEQKKPNSECEEAPNIWSSQTFLQLSTHCKSLHTGSEEGFFFFFFFFVSHIRTHEIGQAFRGVIFKCQGSFLLGPQGCSWVSPSAVLCECLSTEANWVIAVSVSGLSTPSYPDPEHLQGKHSVLEFFKCLPTLAEMNLVMSYPGDL